MRITCQNVSEAKRTVRLTRHEEIGRLGDHRARAVGGLGLTDVLQAADAEHFQFFNRPFQHTDCFGDCISNGIVRPQASINEPNIVGRDVFFKERWSRCRCERGINREILIIRP